MKHKELIIPKLWTVIREGYSFQTFFKDASAGVVVGIVALPLAIAFAIASGVKPEQGLFTAIIAGFLISALSGSRVQIGGPTGAFIITVYGIVTQYGYEGLAVATLMAGVILIIMGFARFGQIIEFIPYPVTIGFTTGIATIILTTQLKDFFGLKIQKLPSHLLDSLPIIIRELPSLNIIAVGIGLISILIIHEWPKYVKRIPGSLVAIIVTTLAVQLLHLNVETIAERFGSIPTSLPTPHLPFVSWDILKNLIRPATTIALLAGLESLLSAIVADGMTGYRHRPNMELIAQGVANIGSVFFGGIPATGAIARTATNIKNGGRTPVAGIIHAATLLCILLLFGKWAGLIPLATLAAILVIVAYHMSEWRIFLKLFRSPKSDIVVLLTTYFLTVLIDLTVAIEVGVVLAAFLFMKRMMTVTEIGPLKEAFQTLNTEEDDEITRTKLDIPKGVEIFEINGPFFFGAADKFKTVLHDTVKKCKILIIRMRHVPTIDASGLRALEDIVDKCHHEHTIILLAGIRALPKSILKDSGLLDKIGKDNVLASIESAVKRAQELLK